MGRKQIIHAILCQRFIGFSFWLWVWHLTRVFRGGRVVVFRRKKERVQERKFKTRMVYLKVVRVYSRSRFFILLIFCLVRFFIFDWMLVFGGLF